MIPIDLIAADVNLDGVVNGLDFELVNKYLSGKPVLLGHESVDTNPFRYCGEYLDFETGKVYLRARYYNPVNGRMFSEDPLRCVTRKMPNGQDVLDPLSLNLYVYCNNNPVSYSDPSGMITYLVHGTWSDNETWSEDFQQYIRDLFGEEIILYEWTGGNNERDRVDAAAKLERAIRTYKEDHPDEPIRIVGHSHGGNVAIMSANRLAYHDIDVETLITVATPVREYQLKAQVGKHINLYNSQDSTQIAGKMSWGINREFDSATNVKFFPSAGKMTKSVIMYLSVLTGLWETFKSNHEYMHGNKEVWKEFIEPHL